MSDDPDCLGLCAIDDDACTGCGRTVDQIAAARAGARGYVHGGCVHGEDAGRRSGGPVAGRPE